MDANIMLNKKVGISKCKKQTNILKENQGLIIIIFN